MPIAICGCQQPIELPDLVCGRCGLRRLGDDLTPQQMEALMEALTHKLSRALVDGDPRVLLRRVRGRKRPSGKRV